MTEAPRAARSRSVRARVPVPGVAPARVITLGEVEAEAIGRWQSGIGDFDFVLGGGIVPGSVALIGGEPGIGKSTLLLQAAGRLVTSGRPVLYVSGEESAAQVKMRAGRLEEKTDGVHILAETDLGSILARASEMNPDLLFIDSIQTVYSPEVDGVPGSIGQVRECAARLHRYAKERRVTVVMVGHVTKGGGIAGPRTLEHIVDTVLYFEAAGGADHRVLRATKNRFGSVDEIGVFRMTAAGLAPVENPSELFLGEREPGRTGCAVTATIEGSRPLLVEIQALTTRAPYGSPQRVAAGFDHKRLAVLLAVLENRAGLGFSQLDAFLNVVGGFRIQEPAADAAVVLALASAARNVPLSPETLAIGEVGLSGELRPVAQLERRLAEAERMGFRRAFVPAAAAAKRSEGLKVHPIRDVGGLLEALGG